jgi:hypothetical protein
MFLGLIHGSLVVHSVIVKHGEQITLRDGWVSIQITLLSTSSPRHPSLSPPDSKLFSIQCHTYFLSTLQPLALNLWWSHVLGSDAEVNPCKRFLSPVLSVRRQTAYVELALIRARSGDDLQRYHDILQFEIKETGSKLPSL